MPVVVSPSDQALFDSSVVVPVLLVELFFAEGPVYLTNWPLDITIAAITYKGLGSLGTVGNIHENLEGSEERVVLELSQVNSSILALALGSIENYQNRDCVIKLLMLHKDTFQAASTPVARFAGFMDLVRIEDEGGKGSIKLECRTGGYAVRSSPGTLMLSHVQHQERYPGELGFQYTKELIEQPTVWLSKKFQSSQI